MSFPFDLQSRNSGLQRQNHSVAKLWAIVMDFFMKLDDHSILILIIIVSLKLFNISNKYDF